MCNKRVHKMSDNEKQCEEEIENMIEIGGLKIMKQILRCNEVDEDSRRKEEKEEEQLQ